MYDYHSSSGSYPLTTFVFCHIHHWTACLTPTANPFQSSSVGQYPPIHFYCAPFLRCFAVLLPPPPHICISSSGRLLSSSNHILSVYPAISPTWSRSSFPIILHWIARLYFTVNFIFCCLTFIHRLQFTNQFTLDAPPTLYLQRVCSANAAPSYSLSSSSLSFSVWSPPRPTFTGSRQCVSAPPLILLLPYHLSYRHSFSRRPLQSSILMWVCSAVSMPLSLEPILPPS